MPRVVSRMPLTELWDDADPVPAVRGRDLTADDIRELLRAGPLRFVVANVASPLRWIPPGECYEFWKSEVQSRLANPTGERLEDFPGEYCYYASGWEAKEGPPIVVLTVAH